MKELKESVEKKLLENILEAKCMVDIQIATGAYLSFKQAGTCDFMPNMSYTNSSEQA